MDAQPAITTLSRDMTIEQMAHRIADGSRNRQGGAIWTAIRDRAVDALNQAHAMGRASGSPQPLED